jgi:rod shape-determining protein MreC
MWEITSSEARQPATPRIPEAPEIVHAFLGRHLPLLILVAVVLAQLVLLAYQVTRKDNVRLIQVWAAAAFDPFERSLHGLTRAAAGAWTSFHDLSGAERENRRLRQELAQARAQILQLSEESTENGRLRNLLDLRNRLPYRTVAAAVIAASPGTSSVIMIDKGTQAGLTSDLPVITPDGIVGKTVAAFDRTAQVVLITDRASGVGSVLEKSETQGVLKGDGDSLCQLRYIMNEDEVSPGDLVVTSGLDQIYPKGLMVGRVIRVHNGDIYKSITVKPAAALDRLENVLVILPSSSGNLAKK